MFAVLDTFPARAFHRKRNFYPPVIAGNVCVEPLNFPAHSPSVSREFPV